MRIAISTLTLLCVVILTACASASFETKTYIPNQVQNITSWYIDFKYQPSAVEKQQNSNGSSNVKLATDGQNPADIVFRDDLFYGLRDDYPIRMTKNANDATGRIEILPVHAEDDDFSSVEVTFLNKQGDMIARMKINNRNYDDADFTKYAIRRIAIFILNQ